MSAVIDGLLCDEDVTLSSAQGFAEVIYFLAAEETFAVNKKTDSASTFRDAISTNVLTTAGATDSKPFGCGLPGIVPFF